MEYMSKEVRAVIVYYEVTDEIDEVADSSM